jgi:hypothetical protein
VLFNPVLLATAAGLVALASRRPRLGLVGMLGFAVADQAHYFVRLTLWEPGSVRSLSTALRELPAFPPVPRGDRLHVVPLRPGAAATRRPPPCLPVHVSLAGLAMTEGYVGLVPRRRLDLEWPESLRLAGVAWTWDDQQGAWKAVENPLPRARCVNQAIVSDDPSRLADLDLETTAVVSAPLAALGGRPGRVAIEQDRPGSFVAEVTAPARQLFVWNESYHPGWAATLDGRPHPVVRVNFDYLGCLVPPGRHTVAFRYRPRSFQVGAVVSAAGVLLLIGWETISGWGRTRSAINRFRR